MKLISVIATAVDWAALTSLVAQEDIVLLRQDAVFLALKPSLSLPCTLLALQSDVDWRQVQLPSHIHAISAEKWVQLAAAAKQNLLWR